MKYDPLAGPDPREWAASGEDQRLDAVLRYHRRARVELPNERAHALIHMTVENQAALGDETPVAETLQRLTDEGLDRHEAVHAVGSVLARHIWEMLGEEDAGAGDPNLAYFDEVRDLTMQKWFDEYGDDED